MKGLILSGGAGTRLRPITHTSAKQLVPVANKPILFYGIEDMARTGIDEIGIVVGETRDEIVAAVGDGSVDAASRIEGRVVIEEGAVLVNSTVRGPAIVGRGTQVRDSYIGPYTSVYFGCEILNSEIEHSVVLEQSRIEGVPRLQDSLVGKQVVVTRSQARPKATRLMLGDHSVVDLE